MIKVDSLSLFDELDALFTKYRIPCTNLVSILIDSCNVMRGSKSGVEPEFKVARLHSCWMLMVTLVVICTTHANSFNGS